MPDKIIWKLNDPGDLITHSKKVSKPETRPAGPQKNPALAFSLSLVLWGGGQLYNRQRQLGLLFLLLMVNFYTILGLVAVYWEFMIASLKTVPVTFPMAFIAFGIFYALGLIFWVFNALQAYHHANMFQPDAFQGIQSFLLPVAGSLLVPGWGQFLNGQPRKGGYFLIFTVAGFLAIPSLILIPWLWSSLETAKDRLLLEGVLLMGLVLLLPASFMWLLSIYDALKVSLDPLKKEPIRKRIKYAANRLRVKGWGRGVLPQAKLILMLSLFLVLSLTLSYYYFPQRYYTALLENLQSQLSRKEMVLIPHLINKFLQITIPQQPHR